MGDGPDQTRLICRYLYIDSVYIVSSSICRSVRIIFKPFEIQSIAKKTKV